MSLGIRAERVSETDDQVVLTTDAGRVIEADAVVAANGTHSLLRDYVLGHHVERRYVGYVNWNASTHRGSFDHWDQSICHDRVESV